MTDDPSPTPRASGEGPLIELLDRFVASNAADRWDMEALARIAELLTTSGDPEEFRRIADRVDEEYFIVPVDDMIAILRRWLAVAPTDPEAKRALGQYLYAHGPDWDDEARELIRQADEAEGRKP